MARRRVAGHPVNGSIARPTSAAPIDIRMVVDQGIEAALDRGVPAGVAERGKQHGGKDEESI